MLTLRHEAKLSKAVCGALVAFQNLHIITQIWHLLQCLKYRWRLTVFNIQVPSHSFNIDVMSHNIYYTVGVTECILLLPKHIVYYAGAVTRCLYAVAVAQYLRYWCPHKFCVIQVPSHNISYKGAVTQYLLYRCRHTILTILLPSHNIYYTSAVTHYFPYRCHHTIFTIQVPSKILII